MAFLQQTAIEQVQQEVVKTVEAGGKTALFWFLVIGLIVAFIVFGGGKNK